MTQEIPVRRTRQRTPVKGRHASRGSNAGQNRHKGETNRAAKELAQAQTRQHQRALVMDGRGHRVFVLASQLP